jgi:hypothetical protein
MVRRVYLVLMFAALLTVTLCLHAQQSSIVKLTVEKKPGALDGRAMATVKGPAKVKGKVVITEKTGRIATQAIQAWIVLDGQGALLLLSPEKKACPIACVTTSWMPAKAGCWGVCRSRRQPLRNGSRRTTSGRLL